MEIDLKYYFGDIPEKIKKKSKKLLEKYIEMFEYDPADDVSFNFTAKAVKGDMLILEECIRTKKSYF